MLKYKILNTDQDSFIELPLNLDFNPMDNQELVEELIREEKRKSINIQKDLEIVRYSPLDNDTIFNPELLVLFYNCDTGNYSRNYDATGFNTDKTLNDDRLKKVFSRSFYIMDFYDSTNEGIQNKLTSTIIPTVPSKNVNKLSIDSKFIIEPNTEGYFIYYLKNIDLPKDIFMKLIFFNAKAGKRISFFNVRHPDVSLTSPTSNDYNDNMLYFKYRLNEDFTYNILDSNLSTKDGITSKIISAREVRF